MRQQYHSRQTPEGNYVWNVRNLAKLVKDLPVKIISLTDIKELDEEYWYGKDETFRPTCRNVAEHAQLIQKTSLDHPIILCAEGRVMDGMHRICKALNEGRKTIRAVQFKKTPDPDYKNANLADLPYDTEPNVEAPNTQKKALKIFIVVLVFLVCLLTYYSYNQQKHAPETSQTSKPQKTKETNNQILPAIFSTEPEVDPILTEESAEHILHGNEKSGGHLYGTGRPCKSEFPQSWDETKILDSIKTIAANDNLPWEKEANGYYVADSRKDGVRVRVVLNGDRTRIITGYPTNMPRNPCLPANDNSMPTRLEPAPITPE